MEARALDEESHTDVLLPERPTGPAGGLTGIPWTPPDLSVEDVQKIFATGATGAADDAAGATGIATAHRHAAPEKTSAAVKKQAKVHSALEKAKTQLQLVEGIRKTRSQEVRNNLDLTVEERGHLVHSGTWGEPTKMGNMTNVSATHGL